MKQSLIIPDNASLTVSWDPTAQERKDAVLFAALPIKQVTNKSELERAVSVQADLRALIGDVEKERKRVKAPVLDYGKAIDEAAREWVADIQAELDRVQKINSEFAAEQERIRRKEEAEAEAKRRAELARVEAQRQAELKRLRDEEEARQAIIRKEEAERAAAAKARAEEERKAIEAEDAKQLEAIKARHAESARVEGLQAAERERELALAQAKSADEMDRIAAEADAKMRSAILAPATTTAVKVDGQRVSTDWEITVTDAGLLAQKHPECVTITPRLLDIKDRLNAGLEVAGVRAERVTKSTVSRRKPQVIDV